MEEWKSYRLGDVINVLDYKRVPLSSKERESRKGIYPYYGAQGIIDYIDDFIFDGEYLLIAEDGENLKSQKQNIAQIAKGKYWVNNHAHIVESNGKSDIRFICYLLNKMDLSGYITGSAQPKLNQANLLAIEVCLPDLATQIRIARCLSIFDDKIALNNRINHNLEKQIQYRFDQMILADNTESGCQVADIIDINPRRELKKGQLARSIEMSYLSKSSSFPSGWEFKEYYGGMKFENGDTIMARITPCLENGKVAYVDFLENEETAFGSTEYLVLRSKPGIPLAFTYFLARNNDFVDYATKNMNGSSGRQRVSGDVIGRYPIPILNNQVLASFDEASQAAMNIIRNNSFENLTLAYTRDTLLPLLLSGDLIIKAATC